MQDTCLLCDKSHGHRVIYDNNSLPAVLIDERNRKKVISVLIKLFYLPEVFNEYLDKCFFCYHCIIKMVQLEELYFQLEYFQGKIVQNRRNIELELISATYRDDQNYQEVNKSYTKETRKIICDLIQVKSDPENDIILNGNSVIGESPSFRSRQQSRVETPPKKMSTSFLSTSDIASTSLECYNLMNGDYDQEKQIPTPSKSNSSLGLDDYHTKINNDDQEKGNGNEYNNDGSDLDHTSTTATNIVAEEDHIENDKNLNNKGAEFNSNSDNAIQKETSSLQSQIVIEMNTNMKVNMVDEDVENCKTKGAHFEDRNSEEISPAFLASLDLVRVTGLKDHKAEVDQEMTQKLKKKNMIPIKRKGKPGPLSSKSPKERKLLIEKEATLKDLDEICIEYPLHKCMVILTRLDEDNIQEFKKNPVKPEINDSQKNGEITLAPDSNSMFDKVNKQGRGRGRPKHKKDSVGTPSEGIILTNSDCSISSKISATSTSTIKSRSRISKKALNKPIEENSVMPAISTESKHPKENENALKKKKYTPRVSSSSTKLSNSLSNNDNDSLLNGNNEKKCNKAKKRVVKDSKASSPPSKLRKIETTKPSILNKKKQPTKLSKNTIQASADSLLLLNKMKVQKGKSKSKSSPKSKKSGKKGLELGEVQSITFEKELFAPDKIIRKPKVPAKKKVQKNSQKAELKKDQSVSHTEPASQEKEIIDPNPKTAEDSVNVNTEVGLQSQSKQLVEQDNLVTELVTKSNENTVEDSNNKDVDEVNNSQTVENNDEDESQDYYFRCPYTTCPVLFPDKIQLITHLKAHMDGDGAQATE